MSHDLVSELNPDTMMTYLVIDMTGNDLNLIQSLMTYLVTDMSR